MNSDGWQSMDIDENVNDNDSLLWGQQFRKGPLFPRHTAEIDSGTSTPPKPDARDAQHAQTQSAEEHHGLQQRAAQLARM